MVYDAKLLGRENVAGEVAVFRLERPEGFDFVAGQWCFVSVPDLGFQDDRGLRRSFSIASSPLDKELVFVTKLSSSALKRTMAGMPVGTNVTLEEAQGKLVLPKETAAPLVFLAGGVGISPFRSMIRYALDAQTGHAITLFYSNRTPEETPFLEELSGVGGRDGRIKVIITMTRAGEGSKWSGRTGRLGPDMIREECISWETASYYIVGPPNMAAVMRETLDTMRIAPERITTELFAGY